MSSRPSTNNDDEDTPSVYLGTRQGIQPGDNMRTNAMDAMRAAALADGPDDPTLNTALAGKQLRQFDSAPGRQQLGMWSRFQQPTVWDAVNYPHEDEFTFESFYLRYVRQSEAQAIIDKPANDTWQSTPIVHDEKHQNTDEPVSEFEKKVKEFLAGEHTRRKPIHRLNTLHKLARLGHYAVLVIGFADGRPLSTPVAGITDEPIDPEDLQQSKDDYHAGRMQVPETMEEPEFGGLDDLMYLSVFAEDRVIGWKAENDMRSPRFRLPKYFDIITQMSEQGEEGERDNEYQNEQVHWSRCIHAPEGTLENDLEGIPALKPCFHELLNIDKIKAASGEGFWRAGYTGLHIQPPKDSMGVPVEFDDGGEGVHQEVQDYLNNLERELATPAEISPINVSVSDPRPHMEINYQSLAASTDIPKSILTGEDRADTASSEDVRQWHQKIGQIRNNFAGPVILEPLIQRLIDAGILPEPEGDGFVIDWQPLDELDEQQQWELRETIANSIATLSPGGDTNQFGTVPELRQAIGWGPQLGSEVDVDELQRDSAQHVDEVELQVDEAVLPDYAPEDVEYPEELYDTPAAATERATELGIEGYHVHRVDGVVFYMPGDDHSDLVDVLETDESEAVDEATVNTTDHSNHEPPWTEGDFVQWQANPSMFGEIVHIDWDDHVVMVTLYYFPENAGDPVESGYTVTAGFEDIEPLTELDVDRSMNAALPKAAWQSASSESTENAVTANYVDPQQRHPHTENVFVYFNSQHISDGTVTVERATHQTEDYWIEIHPVTDEDPDAYTEYDNFSRFIGDIAEVGPFEAGSIQEEVEIELDADADDYAWLIANIHYDEDGEPGDHVTDADGNLVFDVGHITYEDGESDDN